MPENATIAERIERRIVSIAEGISGVAKVTRWTPLSDISDGDEPYQHLQIVVFPVGDTIRNNTEGVVGCDEHEKTVQIVTLILPSEAGGSVAAATLRTRWIGKVISTFSALDGRLTETGGTNLTVDLTCEEENEVQFADGMLNAAVTLRIIYRTSRNDPFSYDTLITAQA